MQFKNPLLNLDTIVKVGVVACPVPEKSVQDCAIIMLNRL